MCLLFYRKKPQELFGHPNAIAVVYLMQILILPHRTPLVDCGTNNVCLFSPLIIAPSSQLMRKEKEEERTGKENSSWAKCADDRCGFWSLPAQMAYPTSRRECSSLRMFLEEWFQALGCALCRWSSSPSEVRILPVERALDLSTP